jgi:ubiquinone biosynthesis protein
MPAAYIRELSMLQMSSAPLEWAQIEPELRASLGSRLSEAFAEIDPEPLATASVGQVHAGVLVTGEPVVIKVQKRSARAQVTADIDIVQRLARRLDSSTAWGRSVGVLELADGFTQSLLEELDYTIEADNMASVAAAGDAEQVAIPHVYADLSSATVLVMQRLSGRTVGAANDIIAAMPIEFRASAGDKLLGAVLRKRSRFEPGRDRRLAGFARSTRRRSERALAGARCRPADGPLPLGWGPASGAFRPALRFGQSAQAGSATTDCGCLPHARSLGGHPTTA